MGRSHFYSKKKKKKEKRQEEKSNEDILIHANSSNLRKPLRTYFREKRKTVCFWVAQRPWSVASRDDNVSDM